MPYRAPRLRTPGAPRTVVKGKYVILAMLGTLCLLCLGASFVGRFA